jgi:ribosomal protein S18 acetylase RimI-like enzyme
VRLLTEPVIRPMAPDDIPTITEWMLTDSLWQRYGLTDESIERGFRKGLARDDLLIVADTERPARGFAWCLYDGMFGSYPYLKRLGVASDASGRGLGSNLLRRVEEAVVAAGHSWLFLLVSDFNLDAQRFYARHGYQQIGSVPALVLPDVTELIYRKDLGTLSYSP